MDVNVMRRNAIPWSVADVLECNAIRRPAPGAMPPDSLVDVPLRMFTPGKVRSAAFVQHGTASYFQDNFVSINAMLCRG